jgi:hypothetical protein
MRGVVPVAGVVAGLIVGVLSVAGSAAASHRVADGFLHHATAVTWSPDGKQIAFSYIPFDDLGCGCGKHVRSWIVRTSSKPDARRTVREESGKYVGSLFWAAGGHLLFTDGLYLLSVGLHGGKAKRVVAPDCQADDGCQVSELTLSPNRRVAAVRTCDCSVPHGGGLIELVRLRPGGESVQMTQAGAFAVLAFSPDSTQVVFFGSAGLMALPVAGGDPVPLAQSGIPGASLVPGDARQVEWSPDGRWVAYVEDHSSDSTETLEVVSTVGGGTPRTLAACSLTSGYGPHCLDFSWSHASKLLAFDYTSGSPTSQTWHFLTVRPDGTGRTNLLRHHRLANVSDAQWSPDASRLVFIASRPNLQVAHVWTIRADGRGLTRLG